jgi:hypothetical protein
MHLRINLNNKEKEKIIMAGKLSKIGFGYHLTAYLAINAVLLWINFDTSPQNLWAKWPIIGWGIGLAFHGLSVAVSSTKVNKGLIYHLAAYILVNALLIFINFSTYPEYLWFKFPLIAWTFIIAFHCWRVFSKKES